MIGSWRPGHWCGLSHTPCLAAQNLSSWGYTPSLSVNDAFMYSRVSLSMALTTGSSIAAILAFFSSGIPLRSVPSSKKDAAVFLGFHFFFGSSDLKLSSVTDE